MFCQARQTRHPPTPRRPEPLDLRRQRRCVPGTEGPSKASLEHRQRAARKEPANIRAPRFLAVSRIFCSGCPSAAFPRRGPVFGSGRPRSPVVLKREFSSKLHTLQPYLPYMVNGGAYIRQPASARSRARDKYHAKHVTCIRTKSLFDLCMPPRTSAHGAQRA